MPLRTFLARRCSPHSRTTAIIALSALLAAGVLSVYATSPSPQLPQQKPKTEHLMHSDGGPGVPSTLEGLWNMSELVIEGVLVAEEPADIVVPSSDGRTSTLVQTIYSFLVLSEIKPDLRGGESRPLVKILRVGGSRDRGDRIDVYVDDRFASFQPGEHALLFLKHARDRDLYYFATAGADSAFRLTDGVVKAFGSSRLSRLLERRSRDECLASLRAQKKGRQ